MAPDSLTVRFNYGELLREQSYTKEAVVHLQAACEGETRYLAEMLERLDLSISQVAPDSESQCEVVTRTYIEKAEEPRFR